MEKISQTITRNHKVVLIIGAVFFVLCLLGMSLSKVNSDIISYFPNDLPSTQGSAVYAKNFAPPPTALVLTDLDDVNRIMKLKQDILRIEGIDSVTWLDSLTDAYVPLNQIGQNFKDQVISGDKTVMSIAFKKDASTEVVNKGIGSIKKLLTGNSILGGVPAVTQDLMKLIGGEAPIFVVCIVLFLLVLPMLMLDSFLVPLLVIIPSVVVGIIFNMGTNFIKGEVSILSVALSGIFLFGIILDFSIFLYRRYEQERNMTGDKCHAMAIALNSTSKVIITASFAIIAVLLGLTQIKFEVGGDLCFVLSKGIILAAIVCMTILPSLILLFEGAIDKTRHRSFVPTFAGMSEFITKHHVIVVIIAIVLFIPAFMGKGNIKTFYNYMDIIPQDLQGMKDSNEIKKTLGLQEMLYLIVDKSEPRSKEEALLRELKNVSGVKNALTISTFADAGIPGTFLPDALKATFFKDNYYCMTINLTTKAGEKNTNQTVEKINELAKKAYGENAYWLSGDPLMMKDMASVLEPDFKTFYTASLVILLILLVLVFRSISVPVILVATIQFATLFNLAIPYFTGSSVLYIFIMLVYAMQLGTTINYAVLMTCRYKEELQENDKFTAIKNAVMGVGPSIITSTLMIAGTTLIIGLVTKLDVLGQFLVMLGLGTLVSFISVLIILPALLVLFNSIIKITTIGWKSTNNKTAELDS